MTGQSILLLKKLIASFLLPPFNLILLGLAGLWLLKRKPKLGKSLIILSLSLLYLLSSPFIANRLMSLLETDIAALPAGAIPAAEAIVVLGGGVYHDAPEYAADVVNGLTLERLQYAAFLQQKTGLPVLVTGGSPEGGISEAVMMQQALQQSFKVPVQWLEENALDTAQNAQFSTAMLKAAGIRKILLVSHAWHLPRARIEFEKRGLSVTLAPTRFSYVRNTQHSASIFDFLPQARALLKSHYAIHEGIGLLWYKYSL